MFNGTMVIKHAFAYQNQVLDSRKNMVSSVVSKDKGKLFWHTCESLDWMDLILFYFKICYMFFFHLYILGRNAITAPV